MLVVGIDPGAAKTGVAWIREQGTKITRAVTTIFSTEVTPYRYMAFLGKLNGILSAIPEAPSAVAIEEPIRWRQDSFSWEDMRSLVHLEGIYAVAVAEVVRRWPSAVFFPWKPMLWRGDFSSKEKVMERMSRKYGITFKSDDESDAVGIADHAFGLMKNKPNRKAVCLLEPRPADDPIMVVVPPGEAPHGENECAGT